MPARSLFVPILVAILALIGLAAFLLFALPQILVSVADVPDAAQRLELQNNVRTTGIQLLAGIVLATGALFTALTLRINREGQITERFTRAIDQLGNKSAHVRMGGIYALARTAANSKPDQPAIVEILAAFIKDQCRWHGPGPIERSEVEKRYQVEKVQHDEARTDVQAALTMLGRLPNHKLDFKGLVLRDVALRGVSFEEPSFEGAILLSCDLQNAVFTGKTVWRKAIMDGINAEGATFSGSDFQDAQFRGRVTNFRATKQWGVHFDNVDLSKVVLNDAEGMRSVSFSEDTRWPKSFDLRELKRGESWKPVRPKGPVRRVHERLLAIRRWLRGSRPAK